MGRYTGLTTLERLEAAGLLQDFELAVKQNARDAALKILRSVELTEAQALVVYEGAARIKRDVGL